MQGTWADFSIKASDVRRARALNASSTSAPTLPLPHIPEGLERLDDELHGSDILPSTSLRISEDLERLDAEPDGPNTIPPSTPPWSDFHADVTGTVRGSTASHS